MATVDRAIKSNHRLIIHPTTIATHLMSTQPKSMRHRLRQIFPSRQTRHNAPPPLIFPEPDYKKEYMLSEAEAQWNDTFRDSLRDFQLKFEEEQTAQAAGERARQDEFDRTMTNLGDIFLRNHLRRQETYEKADALREERFQKADAAREAIFVQGQQDRAHAFEIEEEIRAKRVEWYSTVRKELFREGRQKLTEKCDALNAALMEQFDRLMEGRKEIMEDAEEQSSLQDTLIPPPDGGSGTVDSQSVTSSPLSPESLSSPSLPCAESLYSSPQPRSTISDDKRELRISRSTSTWIIRSQDQASSSPNPESLNSLMQATFLPESNEQQEQEQSPHLVEQGDPERSTHSANVEDKFYPYFMRSQEKRQKKFLRAEWQRKRRFCASQDAREESKRSAIFDKKMNQWLNKSLLEHIRGREEERFRREIQRSTAFWNADSQRVFGFKMAMFHMIDQAYAEENLEEIHFKRQEDMLLALYERQAIQLNQRTEDQIVWFKFMRDRKPYDRTRVEGTLSSLSDRLGPYALIGSDKLIEKELPIPRTTDTVEHFVKSKRMQETFEKSQELRAEAFQKGAKERNYTFRINEARREAEFVNVQQERKEIFDQAEESHQSGFEEAQQQRESEFLDNERKREDDFYKNEVERNDRTRKAPEERARLFQQAMLRLQQDCIRNEEGRLKELERLGEELIMSREQGLPLSHEKFPCRALYRSLLVGDVLCNC